MGAHFRGWLEVVVVANNHCPQERAYALVFERDGRWCTGGGGCNMPPSRTYTRSFSREMGGGGGGCNMPPLKTSTCACF